MIGKKYLVLGFTITAVLCISTKIATAQMFGKKKQATTSPESSPKIDSASLYAPLQKKISIKNKHPHYNIALLLPFNVMQSMEIDTSGDTHYDFTPETSLSIQFYHGALLALDSLKKTGIKLNVFTLDGGTDSNTLHKIFRSGVIDSMNLIIGPVYNSSLRAAAVLAKQKHKMLISPFSSSENITNQNSYYVSANPTLSRHFYQMFSYIQANYNSKKIMLLYNKDSADSSTVRLVKSIAKNFSGLNLVCYTDKTDTSYANLDTKQFSLVDTNIIIVPSMDEDFTGIITKQLYDYSATYPMVVFGMPTWNDFETLRLDYLSAMHCLITGATWSDKNTPAWKNFEHNFINTYHTRPLERNVTGYDEMMLAVNLLPTDSTDVGANILTINYKGLAQNFKFIPYYKTSDHSGDPDFLENADVHVFRFKDNSLVKCY